MNTIPIATFMILAESTAAGLQRTRTRTHRAEVHEEGEGDDPTVHGIDDVTAIQLEEEPTLDTQTSERNIEQWTDQKTIG